MPWISLSSMGASAAARYFGEWPTVVFYRGINLNPTVRLLRLFLSGIACGLRGLPRYARRAPAAMRLLIVYGVSCRLATCWGGRLGARLRSIGLYVGHGGLPFGSLSRLLLLPTWVLARGRAGRGVAFRFRTLLGQRLFSEGVWYFYVVTGWPMPLFSLIAPQGSNDSL